MPNLLKFGQYYSKVSRIFIRKNELHSYRILEGSKSGLIYNGVTDKGA